jgi:hypothetical protein
MASSAQKFAVILAFVAAALSFLAAAIGFSNGRVPLTPLAGGALMLALGVSGLARLRNPPPS